MSKAKTVQEYLVELSEERREAAETVRQVILKNLPNVYGDETEAWFKKEYTKSDKKLNMGQSGVEEFIATYERSWL